MQIFEDLKEANVVVVPGKHLVLTYKDHATSWLQNVSTTGEPLHHVESATDADILPRLAYSHTPISVMSGVLRNQQCLSCLK